MKTKLVLVPILLIVSSIFFLGCFGVDSNFSEVKNDIFSNVNVKFHKNIEFSIGSVGLSFASAVSDFSDDDNAHEIIRNLSKVQIGVYKYTEPVSRQAAIEIIKKIDDRLQDNGWNYVVKSYDKREVSSVYTKCGDDNKLREMFVVNLNDDELVIVDIKGKLERILTSVIRDKRMDLSYNH